jgi:dethiobiotin synthetase
MGFKKLKFRGVFITATDTSVGKTTVAAGLVGFLKKQGVDVGVMKPVTTGAIERESGKLVSQDAQTLVEFSGSRDPLDWISPYRLATPVTPSLASRIEGVRIEFDKIRGCFQEISGRHAFVVVEGAGGVMSPVSNHLLVVDMIRALHLPAIVVSRATLGTINHTLLTLECLQIRQIETLGFLLNRFPRNPGLAERTNAEIIVSLSGVPHLGSVLELGDLFTQQDVIEAFSNSVREEKLLQALCG